MTAVDALTAPEFRRQGLLTRGVNQIHAHWQAAGVDFVIGLPNEEWGSRKRALGWQHLFPLQWMIRPLRPEILLAVLLNLGVLKRTSVLGDIWNRFLQSRLRRDATVEVASVVKADDCFDRLWQSCRGDFIFSTVRDRAWVEWRFLSCPSRHYQITLASRGSEPVGYLAHSLIETERGTSVILAETVARRSDYAARDILLHNLIESALSTDARFIRALAIPGTEHFRWLRRAGFFSQQAFSVEFVPLAADLPLDLMRSRGNWSLSGADFDVV